MLSDRKSNCRVCGLHLQEPPWGENGTDPNWEICPCCGVEFGYEDQTVESANRFRNEWIANGAVWFENSEKPIDWKLEHQLDKRPNGFG